MNHRVNRTIMFRARLKPMESDLLQAICSSEGLTASEVVRQAIQEAAKTRGISTVVMAKLSGLNEVDHVYCK